MRFFHTSAVVESVLPLVKVLKSSIDTVPRASHTNTELSSYLLFGRQGSNYKFSHLSLTVYFSIHDMYSYFVTVHIMNKNSGFISERIIL